MRSVKTIEELDAVFKAIDRRQRKQLKRARKIMDRCWREVAALRKKVDDIKESNPLLGEILRVMEIKSREEG